MSSKSRLHFESIEYRDLVLLLTQDEYDQHLQYLKKLQAEKATDVKSEEQVHQVNLIGNIGRLNMVGESNRNLTVGNIGNYAEGNTNISGPSVGIAQGSVDFGSAQNVSDFIKELTKLQTKAKFLIVLIMQLKSQKQ